MGQVPVEDADKYLTQGAALLDQIRELQVTDDQTFTLMASLGKMAKRVLSSIEERYAPHIKRADESHKELIKFRRSVTEKFESAEDQSKAALVAAYQRDPDFQAEGVIFTETWAAEIVDESKLPREYLTPDLKRISGIVLALGPEAHIPGVKAYKRTRVAYRA